MRHIIGDLANARRADLAGQGALYQDGQGAAIGRLEDLGRAVLLGFDQVEEIRLQHIYHIRIKSLRRCQLHAPGHEVRCGLGDSGA